MCVCVHLKRNMKLPVRDHRTMCLLIGLCFSYYIGIGSLALFMPRCCYLAKIAIWLRRERCENEGTREIHTTHTIRTQTLSNGKQKINRVCSSLSWCWQAKLSLKPHTNSVQFHFTFRTMNIAFASLSPCRVCLPLHCCFVYSVSGDTV